MSDFPDYEAAQRAQDAGREAASIVDVALGDEPLFVECEHAKAETFCDVMCDAYVQGEGMIQVWLKEEQT